MIRDMGHRRTPIPVKLFVGMLTSAPLLQQECVNALSEQLGPIDTMSPLLPWDHTNYYREEMGPSLVRQFYFFETLRDPGELPKVKLLSLELEARYAELGTSGSLRRINIDPGYVTEAKVVLATTKDFAHRIYIGMDTYAEVTLRYDKDDRAFQSLEHTYPDFRSSTVRALFRDAREKLRRDLAAGRR